MPCVRLWKKRFVFPMGWIESFSAYFSRSFSWIWLRPSYSVWITLNWFLINSTAFVISVPRYALTLFPMFILFALAVRGRRVWYALLTVWSLLYLALYTGRFAQGLWAF